MLIIIRDYFWPILKDFSEAEKNEIKQEEVDELDKINKTDWALDYNFALQESHRIAEDEEARLKTVESKATNLLLFIGALIPLLTYLEPVTKIANIKSTPLWIVIVLLILAIVYLCKAGLWAFRTLNVGNYHRVYSKDLVKSWEAKDASKNKLIKEILSATRKNQESINSKVTALKMTHAFLLRAILTLATLFLIRLFFELWNIAGL